MVCSKLQILENIPIPGLHGSFSGRDIKASSKQRGVFLASYLNPANLLNVTPEILKDLSLVAGAISIVSKMLMMLYIAGYKSWFVPSSYIYIYRVSSTLWLIIYKNPPDSPTLSKCS
jgi:hypothetical protein